MNSADLPPSIAPSLSRPLRTALRALLLLMVLVFLSSTASAQEPDAFTSALAKGPLFAAFAAFVGGLLVSLTPCVYPMIAVTVSVFGARQAATRREAMLLSTAFVMGIVVLFTTMLVSAALTGGFFGEALAKAWVNILIAVVFIALASSMFGAFEMVLPSSMMQRLSTVGGIGYGGAFALGLVSGLIAAPCTGPVLTGIILWIGKTQNVVLATIVGATFSIGLGIPFWLVGTFAVSLPKGGKWMLGVKSFFGIVMVVVALYFLKNAVPAIAVLARPDTSFLLAMAGLVIVGLLLGAVHLTWDEGGMIVKLRKAIGIAASVVGGFLFVVGCMAPKELPPPTVELPPPTIAAASDPSAKLLTWGHSEPEATASAQSEKRPLLIDFTAEWCAACKELAKHTFADPRVMKKASNFVAVKIDATNEDDPEIRTVMKKYGVVGLPTVVIYDSTGKERKRFNEFVGPEVFLAALEGIN